MRKKYIAIFLYILLQGEGAGQIVLSEIMFNPAGNERYDEYVELYNTSETEAVDLAGWLISDSTKCNTILPFSASALLQPHHFALILVPNYFEKSHAYDADIPDEALLLTIGNAQLGAYGLKNSAGERVSLHRPDSTLVAAFRYTPDNKDGFSEEKINLLAGDGPENWSNSIKEGGTPGYQNSITPSPYDIALTLFTMTPEQPGANDSLRLTLMINNVGKEAVADYEIEVTADYSFPIFSNHLGPVLAPGDSIILRFSAAPFTMGTHTLTARVFFEQDENRTNNELEMTFEVVASYPPGSLVMNEIMYDTDEKSDEWIELFNTTDDSILLKGWRISDKRKSVVLSEVELYLPPAAYCLLVNRSLASPDSCLQIILSLPELNNGGDELALCDATGALIDSVAYTREMGGDRNISLERIRYERTDVSGNWGSCRDSLGSTPGRRNSISPKSRDAAVKKSSLLMTPEKPHSGERTVISVQIVNAGRQALENVRASFSFAEIGSADFMEIGSHTIPFLAVDDSVVVSINWEEIPAGAFILRAGADVQGDMLALNNTIVDTVFVSDSRCSLVINEIMYSPVGGQSEWIEFYNRGAKSVQLYKFTLSKADSSERLVFAPTPISLDAADFLVLVGDSNMIDECSADIICGKLPSLKNDADTIYIFDANGQRIDAVHYSSDWGGSKGRSLERISAEVPSGERSNWSTCVEAKGHTAGEQNSISIKRLPAAAKLSTTPNPFSPDGDGIDDFAGISYELPATTAQVNIKIFDIRGRLVRFLVNNELSGVRRTLFWDGLDDNGRKCRVGIYIIYLEALNETAMCIERTKKTLVLAGAL